MIIIFFLIIEFNIKKLLNGINLNVKSILKIK